MNKIILGLALVACIALTFGCTAAGQATYEAAKTKGAAIADKSLSEAEWFVCKAATVGSVKRHYGTSAEKAALYKEFCQSSVIEGQDVIGPPAHKNPI